jgi:hypothetical protein
MKHSNVHSIFGSHREKNLFQRQFVCHMSALPEPEDPTGNKIYEAKYFLHQIKNRRDAYLSGQCDNELCLRLFKYYLSAFLCSARSILDYMKMQYMLDGTSAFKKFHDGYMQRNKKFKELRFFNDIRVENVHYKFGDKEPYKVKQREQVNTRLEVGMLLEGADGSKTSTPPLQESSVLETSTKANLSQRVPIELLFLRQDGFLDRDTEVVEFCTRQLKTMIELVELCKKDKFTVDELDSFPPHS